MEQLVKAAQNFETNRALRCVLILTSLKDGFWIEGDIMLGDHQYNVVFAPYHGKVEDRFLGQQPWKFDISEESLKKILVLSNHTNLTGFYTLHYLIEYHFARFLESTWAVPSVLAQEHLLQLNFRKSPAQPAEPIEPVHPTVAEPTDPIESVQTVVQPTEPAKSTELDQALTPTEPETILQLCTIVRFKINSSSDFLRWIEGKTFNGIQFKWDIAGFPEMFGDTWYNTTESRPRAPFKCAQHLLDRYIVALQQASSTYYADFGLDKWDKLSVEGRHFLIMNPQIEIFDQKPGFLLDGPEPKLYYPEEVPWTDLAGKGIKVIQA